MRFTRKKHQHGDFGVVVTSLLDVNFLLIMFFLMTAHFQRETHALLNLPRETGEKEVQPDEAGLVVNLNAAGEVIVSNKTISMDELRQRVREQIDTPALDGAASGGSRMPLKLMIRADREARSEDLNRVVLLLREQGVGTIRVATEVPR